MFFRHGLLFFFLLEAFTVFFAIGEIGFFKTLFLLFCAAACGLLLIQRQGLAMLLNVQKSFNGQAVPVDNFFDGFCIVLAGLLLIMPGFTGDMLAICLLIPQIRTLLKTRMPVAAGARTSAADDIIDGSYVRVEESVEQIAQNYTNDSKPPHNL